MVSESIQTAVGLLTIIRVGPNTLDQILVLMQETSDWLLSQGIRQWRRMFTELPGDEEHNPLQPSWK